MRHKCRVERLQRALVSRSGDNLAVELQPCRDKATTTVVFQFDEDGFSESYDVALCEHHFNVASLMDGYTKHFRLRETAA